jgi:pimeloyl-ACP methyl ester carboxylesterase
VTRARYPDQEGYVERDGVRVFWERYGEGEPTILFLPTWTIIHSRCWKAQIAYFARHHRVLTFDPRGNGRSDRPRQPAAYSEREFAADALAVMDATETERAVLVSLSKGAQRAMLVAADYPERTVAAAGWLKFNGAHWRSDYGDFVEWFIRRIFNTPHSTKQIEDAIEWGLETDAETLIASVLGDFAAPVTRRAQTELAHRVRCPVLVITAPNDKINSLADAKALAEATGGQLMAIPDGGHCPQVRKPVAVNLALRDFVQRAFTIESRPVRGAHTAA